MHEDIERPLTVKEVSVALGVHPNTVKRIPPTELPYFTVTSRGDRRYEPASVVRFKSKRWHTR